MNCVASAALGASAAQGAALPSLDLAGFERFLAEHRGRVVVLNFWATWCTPCKWEIPSFARLYGKYRDQGVEILGVNVDGDLERVEKFLRRNPVNYPVYLGSPDLRSAFMVFALPTTVFFSGDGSLVRRHDAYVPEELLEKELTVLLQMQ
jgi:thiol-disulfide isomerase/thioredoxin